MARVVWVYHASAPLAPPGSRLLQLTPAFRWLLQPLRSVCTAPSFPLFVLLLTGGALSGRHRFLTEGLVTAGQVGLGHGSRCQRFFSHYAWSLDDLGRVLARLLIPRFAPAGPVRRAADDTLYRPRGLGLFGTGRHHAPLWSSTALQVFSRGHDGVVLALLVRRPRWAPTKVFAGPLLGRLSGNVQGRAKGPKKKAQKKTADAGGQQKWRRPKGSSHRSRPELLVAMVAWLAGWFPDREFVVCADSASAGQSALRHRPGHVDLISQVHPQGVLYPPPPPKPKGQRGASRQKGERRPDRNGWADAPNSPWQEVVFDPYGPHTTLGVKVRQGLDDTAGQERRWTVILRRDRDGQRPDHRCYGTRLDWDVREVRSA